MGGEKKGVLGEIIRFNIVGAANTFLTYLIYSALLLAGLDYRLALACEYAVGIAFSFAANKGFTFRNRQVVTASMVARMVGSYLLLLALNMVLLELLVERARADRYLAQALALAVVVSLSFFAQKLLVFRRRPHAPGSESSGDANPPS